ncbi:hypothetical protein NK718_20295 [Alsobacter sp. SYSU M60028]|uniref:Uncharacterized protein n=1 Tax=Alsobacter ponti TaxID=2962936 RepID=A0ABT1LH99_9HYPH|nr:hypothetical protein [Alsobacter ponti]MCP8940874.1 hypothetical protein [Alsobacter ponti]
MSAPRSERGWPSAGLFVGPVAWLAHTQASYAVTPWMCAHKWPAVPALAAVAVLAALAGAWLSWRAMPAAGDDDPPGSARAGRPTRFAAMAGALVSVLFALVILTQGAAGLMMTGCER